jgi:FMN phosphatase YigB (HAD superfamily)
MNATAKAWASQIFESFNPKSDWAQFDLGAIEPDDLAFKIAHRLGVSKSEMDALIDSIPNHLSPLSGTVQILSDLKSAGHDLFFLSNMPASYADYLESQHDFFGYFSEGIFSARVQQIKPNLEIFQMANEKFKVSGKDTFSLTMCSTTLTPHTPMAGPGFDLTALRKSDKNWSTCNF